MGADQTVALRLFLTQQAVMELHHTGNVVWMMKEIEDLAPEKRFDWSAFAIPSIKNDPLAKGSMRGIGGIGSSLTVTKKDDPEHERRVVDFLMYLTAPKNIQLIFDRALENDRPIVGPPAAKGVTLNPELQDRFAAFGGKGYEKLNFRGLDDEQESTFEWSILLQDYLGDRITLDVMLERYQKSMLRAHQRIAERNRLDMDPTTNDLELYRASKQGQAVASGFSFFNGTVIIGLMYLGFAVLLTCLYFSAKSELERTGAKKAYVMLLPTFVLLLTFVYYPALSGLLTGFTEWEEGKSRTFIGAQNFVRMSQDSILLGSIGNQILLLITGLLKATVVPFIIAEMVLYLKNKHLQYFFRVAFLLPIVVPAMVVLLIWGFVYDPQMGLLNSILSSVGLENYQQTWLGEPQLALGSIIFLGFP